MASPVVDGLVSDWEALEQLWDYALSSYLKIGLKDLPVLLAEKPYNSSTLRQRYWTTFVMLLRYQYIKLLLIVCRMCEFMFESYGVAAVFLAKDSVLACYACGKTSGLVIDVGGSGTVLSPVQDGWVDTKAVSRGVIGGRIMDAHMRQICQRLLPAKPYPLCRFQLRRVLNPRDRQEVLVVRNDATTTNVHSSYEAYMNLEIGREFREAVGRTADYALDENDPRFKNLPLTQFELPDGTILDVGMERFQMAELLMDPKPANLENLDIKNLFDNSNRNVTISPPSLVANVRDGLPALVNSTVLRCEADQHAALFGNIILTGGASVAEGLSERLKNELDRIVYFAAASGRNRVITAAANERPHGAWLGASIVASMGSFHELWVSRREYEEYGPSIVDKKCP
jgi:actin-like protein 6A